MNPLQFVNEGDVAYTLDGTAIPPTLIGERIPLSTVMLVVPVKHAALRRPSERDLVQSLGGAKQFTQQYVVPALYKSLEEEVHFKSSDGSANNLETLKKNIEDIIIMRLMMNTERCQSSMKHYMHN